MAVAIFDIDLPPVKKRFAKLVHPSLQCNLKDALSDAIPFDCLSDENIVVTSGGRLQNLCSSVVLPGFVYHVSGKLLGGKGGFGSLLRAIGMQIEKTKNKEACRDLSGRRMRDINNEKKLKEWFSRAADRMVEKDRRKKERRERLLQEPKNLFDDQEYMRQKEEVIEEMEAALQAGMEKARKRAHRQEQSENGSGASKKLKSIDAWAGIDVSTLSSSSEDDASSSSSDLDLPPPDLSFSEDEAETSKEQPMSDAAKGKAADSAKNAEQKEGDSDKKTEPPAPELVFDPIELDKVKSIDELASFGLDHLKHDLRRRNLKCGGTLQERAKRLWEVKCPPPPVPKKAPEKPKKSKKSRSKDK